MKPAEYAARFGYRRIAMTYSPGTQTASIETGLKDLSKLPEKNGSAAVRNAVAKGARMVRKQSRSLAPTGNTGNLRKSLEIHKERSRKKGKAVYDIRFSPKYNEFLQKPIKQPGKYGGKNPYAYYPSSMEFGFITAKREKADGFHFMKVARDSISSAAKDATIKDLWEQIEKQWSKINGK